MYFYIPRAVFDNATFQALYNKMKPFIVKDISSSLNRMHKLCLPNTTAIEYQHNCYIQQKYYGTSIYKFSKPLYIWDRDKWVHISGRSGAHDMVRLLDVSLIGTTDDQLKLIFYIIEYSFWTENAVASILSWVSTNYSSLTRIGMRVLRLPCITKPLTGTGNKHALSISSALLDIGSVTIKNASISDHYYIWNGTNKEIRSILLYIQDTYLRSTAMQSALSNVSNDYSSSITAIIECIDAHTTASSTVPNKEPIESSSISQPDPALTQLASKILAKYGPIKTRQLVDILIRCADG